MMGELRWILFTFGELVLMKEEQIVLTLELEVAT